MAFSFRVQVGQKGSEVVVLHVCIVDLSVVSGSRHSIILLLITIITSPRWFSFLF